MCLYRLSWPEVMEIIDMGYEAKCRCRCRAWAWAWVPVTYERS